MGPSVTTERTPVRSGSLAVIPVTTVDSASRSNLVCQRDEKIAAPS